MARGREAGAGFWREALQQWKREAGGLAGAGLRGAQEVFTRKDDRDGLDLDGGGRGIAFVGYRSRELGRQAE
jgi:hypothetical protein